MHASLKTVDVSNTYYIFFLFSDFSVIYVLTNLSCARNELHDFLITLYITFLFSPIKLTSSVLHH
jgi:hypothetical protein